jgi:hypothetical protein
LLPTEVVFATLGVLLSLAKSFAKLVFFLLQLFRGFAMFDDTGSSATFPSISLMISIFATIAFFFYELSGEISSELSHFI